VRTIVGLSLLAVAFGGLLLFFVTSFAARHPSDVNLGPSTFPVGKASRLAARVRDQRAPFLFKDPLTSSAGRELYVQHLGNDDKRGWLAFSAYAPNAPHEVRCILQWSPSGLTFRDPCGGTTYPADGSSLQQYPTKVNAKGVVIVDLRTDVSGASSTTSTTAAR
jgi:hypothetical protein